MYLLPANACIPQPHPLNQMNEEKIRTLMRTDSFEEKYIEAAKLCLQLFERNVNILDDSKFLKEIINKIILFNNLNHENITNFNFKELNILKSTCKVKINSTDSQELKIRKFICHLDNKTQGIATSIHNLRENSLLLLKSQHDASSLASMLDQDVKRIIILFCEELKAALDHTHVDISCQGGGCNEL